MDSYKRLLAFLTQLERERIHYTIEYNREDALMVIAATPMRRWEIEFYSDNHIETDVFVSEGVTSGEEAEAQLKRFWEENQESITP